MVFAEPRGEPSRSELRAGGQKNQESRNFQGSAGEAKYRRLEVRWWDWGSREGDCYVETNKSNGQKALEERDLD
ncbi:hypothetical protein WN944_013737 [Citrus x changshan-huyou]|uniref:Uncharacterized protein n=1 Tax=Citrus x changshan-huyou TaxID=2935761 RepID=A0AAP0M6L1_9ROSI